MNQRSFPINVGRTVVRVLRREPDINGRERILKVHDGIVIQDLGAFVRVYSHAPIDKGGDLSPEVAQEYPLTSPRVWCEHVSERSTDFPIPPLFR